MFMLLGLGIICVFFSIIQIKAIYAESEGRDGLVLAGFVPFYWMILLVGGLILLTLSYVSIRKYIGQRKRKRRRQDRK